MREVIQRKARDESFAIVMNDKTLSPKEKIHRVAIYQSFDQRELVFSGCLRSLLFFVPFEFKTNLLNECRLLRVVELENVPLYEFPQELTEMIHLKYLSLRRTSINKIPYSIRKLRSLEILDLKYCYISSLSKGILELKNLCQLRLRCSSYQFQAPTAIYATEIEPQVPSGIGNLTKLEKLGPIRVNSENSENVMVEIGNLTNLKNLGIVKLTEQNGTHIFSTLEKLKHLTALLLSTTNNAETLSLTSLSSPPLLLQRVFLRGHLQSLPNWIISLNYLGKLVLRYSRLNDDPLRALQGLQNLVVLYLLEAYLGEESSCDIGGYPKLKDLCLRKLTGLSRLVLTQGAMPKLQSLRIKSCRNLETLPMGIEHLGDLDYLLLANMPTILIQNIERGHGPDFWKVEHIGFIKVL